MNRNLAGNGGQPSQAVPDGDEKGARRSRRAFTLIEVMIGAVLLSTLVVSGMRGFRVHQRQLRFNEHRIEAVALAERLLSTWSSQPAGVPIGEIGLIDAQRQWYWRTQLVGTPAVFGQPSWVIRLEVFENLPMPNVVLVSVEFIRPAPAPPLSPVPQDPSRPETPEPPEPVEPQT